MLSDDKGGRFEAGSTPLLGETVHAIQTAVSRARIAWITGLVVTFAFFLTIYNDIFGFNRAMIDRRKILCAIVEGNLLTCSSADSIADSVGVMIGKTVSVGQIDFFFKDLKKGLWELPDLKRYKKQLEDTSLGAQQKDTLKSNIMVVMEEAKKNLVNREWLFDSVTIPGTSVAITCSDLGVIGTLATLIAGFWLLANLHTEHDSLKSFLGAERRAGKWEIDLTRSGFRPSEMRLSFLPISDTFVFSQLHMNRITGCLNLASYSAPIPVGGLILGKVWYDMLSKGLWSWHWPRAIVNVCIYALPVVIWTECIRSDRATAKLLRTWGDMVATEEAEALRCDVQGAAGEDQQE